MSADRLAAALAADPQVRAIREALAGWDGEAWLVGGSIRDPLLGRPLHDVDVAVVGEAEPVARSVGRALGGPAFGLSDAFGSWRVIAPDGWSCDVSELQGETIDDDLARRDFSVNAVAVPLRGGPALDPQGGLADLEAGVLRVIEGAYEADPLRPLRLVRFATELPLEPDADSLRATREHAGRVSSAAPERVFAELRRIVVADRATDGLRLASRLGLLRATVPELDELHGVEQSWFHHLDVFDHTLEVLERMIELESELDEVFGDRADALRAVLAEPLADELTRAEALRFGAVFHDVGKPATREVLPNGRVTFIGHDSVGDEMIGGIFRRLRTSAKLRDYVGALTRRHLVLGFMVHARPLPRRAVHAYLRTCEPVEVEVTLLSCADRLATRGRGADDAIGRHLELARELMPEALAWRLEGPPEPLVRGDKLAEELALEPGPELGALLAELEAAQFAGEVKTPAQAIAHARGVRENARR